MLPVSGHRQPADKAIASLTLLFGWALMDGFAYQGVMLRAARSRLTLRPRCRRQCRVAIGCLPAMALRLSAAIFTVTASRINKVCVIGDQLTPLVQEPGRPGAALAMPTPSILRQRSPRQGERTCVC
jgi:hypothetical protein